VIPSWAGPLFGQWRTGGRIVESADGCAVLGERLLLFEYGAEGPHSRWALTEQHLPATQPGLIEVVPERGWAFGGRRAERPIDAHLLVTPYCEVTRVPGRLRLVYRHPGEADTMSIVEPCNACGELKGAARRGCGTPLPVLCICDGVACRRCGIGRVRRPGSTSIDAVTGVLWYTPGFSVGRPCDLCERGAEPREQP
jgi:hypothetical protein